jgi:AcrR family transcriptional regulator
VTHAHPGPTIAAETPARARLLDAAERLFMERGYAGVTLRDIAGALAIRQASLYHHVPAGKEELYATVMLRAIERHHRAMQAVLEAPSAGLEEDLVRLGVWLAGEPPLNVGRVFTLDLPHISEPHAGRIRMAMQTRANAPLVAVFDRAAAAGELRVDNPALAAGAFRAMMQATSLATAITGRSAEATVRSAVDILLRGILIEKPARRLTTKK